tara:strand:+ start:1519 stop:2415 length:897 start_codon:yes stop_codon:yes gene_type:complete
MEESTSLTLPDESTFIRDMTAVNRFQKVVHSNMVEGQDYGVIPGTNKPTLLKPGAEKIAKLLGLADQYEIVDRQEDWNKPFFRYLIKCSLNSVAHGTTISEGLGECNSMEGKYRWRESKRKCPQCGAEAIIKGKEQYGGGWICFKKTGGCGAKWEDGAEEIESQSAGRVENDDIYSQVNTILKMAKKRALVDAALSAGRLSQVFTQDMEDLPTEPEKSTSTTKAKPIQKSSDEQETPSKEEPIGEFKNVGELLTECNKRGIQRQQVLDFIGVKSSNEIEDLQGAWTMILKELIRVKEN